jgi:cytochrome c biogenesis factor
MQLFNGLYLYEIVLLCLGALLFVVLLVAMVAMLIKGRAIKILLRFFLISILMMGFPAVSLIKIKDLIVTLKRQTRQLEQNPIDQTARAAVAQTVETVTARTYSDPATLTTMAKAQIALGQEVRAQTTAKRAVEADPGNQEAAQVKAQIELLARQPIRL